MNDTWQSKTLLKMIEEIEDYGIFLLNTQGMIQNWNQGAHRIKGYSESEVLGESFEQFYTPEDRALGKPRRLLSVAAAEGKAIDEGWRLRKNGSRFWGSVTITAIHDEQGNIIGYGKLTRDLTELKKASQVRELEMRNKELEQFNYLASHDLQEPLRTVMNYIHLIKEEHGSELNEEIVNYLDVMSKSSHRMSVLIKALLNYSRLGRKSETTVTDCDILVQDVIMDIEGLIRSEKVSIMTDPLPTLQVYSVEMRQLFQNLICNAIKFRKKEVDPIIRITSEFASDKWVFSVSDNGMGIEEKNYEKIFGMFHRIDQNEKREGYGIGLANCKKIVELHGGDIWVASEMGKGSTFYFTISTKIL